MKKRVLRILGLLPLLSATTLLGAGVSAAQTDAATLTRAKTWIEIQDPSHPNWAQNYECELWIDNPSEERIHVYIKWDSADEGVPPEFTYQFQSSDPIIHKVTGDLVNWDPPAKSITIQGRTYHTTTPQIVFEQEVPMPGSWP
jgi:hypothetical protein